MALGLVLVALASHAAHAAPQVEILALDFPVQELRSELRWPGRALHIVGPDCDRWLSLIPIDAARPAPESRHFKGHSEQRGAGPIACQPMPPDVGAKLPPAVPHARRAAYNAGMGGMAYLSGPTDRYDHRALGPATGAERVVLETSGPCPPQSRAGTCGIVVTVEAGPNAVFEDLIARPARFLTFGPSDASGVRRAVDPGALRTALLVVHSTLDGGAALAVLGPTGDRTWGIRAETPRLGRHRWLNPAAVADFDGDHRDEIALVALPHTEGLLQVWDYDGASGKLVKKHEKAGYSNHALGSTVLENAAPADLDGDGRAELVIPTLDRTHLAALSLAGGIRELWRVKLPARAERGVAIAGRAPDLAILVALEDGRVAVVRP